MWVVNVVITMMGAYATEGVPDILSLFKSKEKNLLAREVVCNSERGQSDHAKDKCQ